MSNFTGWDVSQESVIKASFLVCRNVNWPAPWSNWLLGLLGVPLIGIFSLIEVDLLFKAPLLFVCVSLTLSVFLFLITAIKITISSQAHACVKWLARERTLPTASWRPKPGPCWKSTTSHWRRPKGQVSAGGRKNVTKNMGTQWWFLLRFGTTHSFLSQTSLTLASVMVLVLSVF